MSVPTAKIIADSISPEGIRLTTMEVKLHRFVLAELNTHRVFSRNSASSRAIPAAKMLIRVQEDPAMPLFWGKNQSGMAAAEELDPDSKQMAINIWLQARDQMVSAVEKLQKLNVHKQLSNRLLEPWLWHTAIISSTEWDNFFGQRTAINPETGQPYAMPEMYALAMAMQEAYYESVPVSRDYGDWHLPYIIEEDEEWASHQENPYEMLKKISVGRCARVSYLTHYGKRDQLEDIKLADKLISAKPMHPSPLEHIATPHPSYDLNDFSISTHKGNFRGWMQYRHEFVNENMTEFVPNYKNKN